MALLSIDDESLFEAISADAALLLVDFYADWCEPCVYLEEVLLRLEKIAPADLKIIKVDVEKVPDLRRKLHILSVPVLVLYRNGTIVWRMNGFHLEDELLEIVQKFSRETND